MICRRRGSSPEQSQYSTTKRGRVMDYQATLVDFMRAHGNDLEAAKAAAATAFEDAGKTADIERKVDIQEALQDAVNKAWQRRPLAMAQVSARAQEALRGFLRACHTRQGVEWLVRNTSPGTCYNLAPTPYVGLTTVGQERYQEAQQVLTALHLSGNLWEYHILADDGTTLEVLNIPQYATRMLQHLISDLKLYTQPFKETIIDTPSWPQYRQAMEERLARYLMVAERVGYSPRAVQDAAAQAEALLPAIKTALADPTTRDGWLSKALEDAPRLWETTLPAIITNEPDTPAFTYVDLSSLVPGPTPWWDGFIERIHPACRELFMATIFAPFDARCTHRKVTWLRSEGYDGKSTFFNALNRWSGGRLVAGFSTKSLSGEFGMETLIGKRILICGDSQNDQLLGTNAIHSITGSDGSTIVNRKNQPQIEYRFQAMVFVGSNSAPALKEYKVNEVTRLAYIPFLPATEAQLARYCRLDSNGRVMRQADGLPIFAGSGMEDGLISEMPAILHACRIQYERLCPNHREIQIPPPAYNIMLQECGSGIGEDFESYATAYLDFDPDLSFPVSDLRKHWDRVHNTRHQPTDHMWGELTRWLARRGVIVGRESGGDRQRVYRGVGQKSGG